MPLDAPVMTITWSRMSFSLGDTNASFALSKIARPGMPRAGCAFAAVPLRAVPYIGFGIRAGAACATEEVAAHLDAVADHLAAAVLANRSNGMNRALEAVEDVPGAGRHDFEALVVIVTTDLTSRHFSPLSGNRAGPQERRQRIAIPIIRSGRVKKREKISLWKRAGESRGAGSSHGSGSRLAP
jgi:hypothetical protein